MSRETLCRSKRADSRKRAHGREKRQGLGRGRKFRQVAAVDDDGFEILRRDGGRRARAAVEEQFTEEVSGARGLEDDALAGVVLEEDLDSPERTM
jgi:hypothetical protein